MGLLLDAAGRPLSWDEVVALAPTAVGAFTDVQREVWDHVDPVLLELARLRMARLLGATSAEAVRSERAMAAGLTDAKVGALASWPTSPLFSERERACLTLAEQYLVDVQGVTDEHTARVLEHLSPAELYGFVVALWAFEQAQRIELVLGIEMTPEELGLVEGTT